MSSGCGNLGLNRTLSSAAITTSGGGSLLPNAGVVTTFAGTTGIPGNTDGIGTNASFTHPYGIVADQSRDVLYVTDAISNTIRKITAAGVVTTFAGTAGVTGSADGTGAAATFNNPYGIGIDSAGNLYVSDGSNNTIRKITPGGVVSTLAGTPGVIGSLDGTGASASFSDPEGIAVDSAGNVYVADAGNYIVRKITPAGVVTTLAGTAGVIGNADGTGGAASFDYLEGLALDSQGNIFLAENSANTIRKITPAGVVTTFVGTAGVTGSADGVGASASFSNPGLIAADSSDNLYVADSTNNTIRVITSAGVVTTLVGTPGVTGTADGTGPSASFGQVWGIAIDAAGSLFITDSPNRNIRKIQ